MSPHAYRCNTRLDVVTRILLVYPSRGDEAYIGEWRFQCANIGRPSELGAGENFNEVGASLYPHHHFARTQHARQNCDTLLHHELHGGEIQSRAGDEFRSSIQASPRRFDAQDRAGADDHSRMLLQQMRNQLRGLGNRHGEFHDRYASVRYGLGGEHGVFRCRYSDRRNQADTLNLRANVFSGHRRLIYHGARCSLLNFFSRWLPAHRLIRRLAELRSTVSRLVRFSKTYLAERSAVTLRASPSHNVQGLQTV